MLVAGSADCADALISLVDGPGPGQRIVDHRDLVVKDVSIGRVEIKSLFEDRLIVAVERQTARIINAGALEISGLDFEHVILAVVVLIDPLSDRVAGKGRFLADGPVAPVGEDPAQWVVTL